MVERPEQAKSNRNHHNPASLAERVEVEQRSVREKFFPSQ